jgi:hypothetical protein
VSALGGELHPPDAFKHTPKSRLRRHASGSIRVQEGQPRKSPIFVNTLLTQALAGFELGPAWEPQQRRQDRAPTGTVVSSSVTPLLADTTNGEFGNTCQSGQLGNSYRTASGSGLDFLP